ncbi:hypothetical protein LPTSP3_g21420 [Leptospira kobayashii]|uniref:Zeta toxin domain-containing protein n=2 Tax=Leptospira kobayashii TaxID=1917830 RepID=A0ABN6KHV2_9LEPT|nr:hypothetical protein LPTSP3_g21420 [Leptospira kobayashii]
MFAGPNGSGKSSLYDYLRNRKIIHTEVYVSADRIEAELRTRKYFVFNAYRISTTEEEFFLHVISSGLWNNKSIKQLNDWFQLKNGVLRVKSKGINSYTASFIASYLVDKLLLTKQSFCFETVMSHDSKISILKEAKKNGYQTYLYFVFTRDPELNIQRVNLRVRLGGHNVSYAKINERYSRSIRLFPKALAISDRAYLIDNSLYFETIGEKKNGSFFWSKGKKSKLFPKL